MFQIPAYNALENQNFNINDNMLLAYHLITTTVFTPKYSIPNLPQVGASFYNLVATEFFTLDEFKNDIASTGNALNYSQDVITLAQDLITNISIEDVYVLFDASTNTIMYLPADQLQMNQIDVTPQLIKMVNIQVGNNNINIPLFS